MIRAAGEDIRQGIRGGEAGSEVRPIFCPKRTYERGAVFFADLARLMAMAIVEAWLRMHVEAPFVGQHAGAEHGS